ncbi:hypothetical protein ANCCEY_03146, partial [Ancylostoma ceylanicum]
MPTTTAALLIVILLTVAVTTTSSSDCKVDATLYRSLIEEGEELVHCVTSRYTETYEGCSIDDIQEGFARSDAIDTAQCFKDETSIECYCNSKCTEDELVDLLDALLDENRYLDENCAERFLESWKNSRSADIPDDARAKSHSLFSNEDDRLEAPFEDFLLSIEEMGEFESSPTSNEATSAVSTTEEHEVTTTSAMDESSSTSTATTPERTTRETTPQFGELKTPTTRNINVPRIPDRTTTTSIRTKTSSTSRTTNKKTSTSKTTTTRATTRGTTLSRTKLGATKGTTRGFSTQAKPGKTTSTTRGFSTQTKPGKTTTTTRGFSTQTKPGKTTTTTRGFSTQTIQGKTTSTTQGFSTPTKPGKTNATTKVSVAASKPSTRKPDKPI